MIQPILRLWFLVVLACALAGCTAPGSLAAEHLACEFRENPQGIHTAKPRLSWKLRAIDAAERQTSMSAFQVVVTADPRVAGGRVAWDSGIVRMMSDSLPTNIEYGGPAKSGDVLSWQVRVWDQAGRESGWSKPASFGIGLLEQSDWKGEWIGLDEQPEPPLTAEVREELRRRPWIRSPGGPERHERVSHFRGEFDLGAGTIAEAWFAGTADMIGELHVNGSTIGQLARWELIRPIDVKAALVPGQNAIGIRVEHHDGFNPAATGMLFVRYADGKTQRVVLDKMWRFSNAASPERGWDRIGFKDADWKSAEESPGQPWGGSRNTEHFMPPAPYLRKAFALTAGKHVARATLYATALGVYECRINGARVGNSEFAPGWTEYSKRVEHQTYDVTNMIVPGDNCLGAILGDGWYAGLMGYTGKRRYYGGPARFMAQLEVVYSDGTREIIATDPTWKAEFGPIRHTDNYMGSEYDSRLEMPGWDLARFDAGQWKPVEVGIHQRRALREADVTDKVAAAIKSPTGAFVVGPSVLGDPAYGVVKTLRVQYTADGKPREISLREGESLNLPRPGEPGPIVITKAVFGEPPPPPAPAFVIEPQRSESVRRFEELPARAISEPRPGRYVFDLGQNMVGWTRLKVAGMRGQRLVVRHAEMLNPDGTLYTSNLRGATATDIFTLKGGQETLEPPFTFHGFRYVEVTGLSSKPDVSMVTGIVAHSAITPAGSMTTSSPLVNALIHNVVWGQKGNYFEVPTDCPQRDERLGWTGDAQFFINTAAYTFDIASFMSRWIKTLAQDAQFPDGTFAHVAPKVNERGGSTAWGDAAIVCTHALYTTYADTRVIKDNYDALCRYMVWLDTRTANGIAKVGGFGDWLNLGDPTSPDLIDTAYRAELCRLMAEMAAAIGKREDAGKFTAAREATITAFRSRFVQPDGSLKDSGQTGYALAFTMGLIPDELREKAGSHFAAAIEKKNWHLATGFIGTPRLLPALHKAGQSSVAARLLLNDDYPSWLYQVKLGATTMWERWDGWTPERGFSDVGMNSFNHYAFGSVGDYLYRHIAGIAPLAPGYSRLLIAPTLTPGLDHIEASYDSIAGTIKSAWRRTKDGVEYDITIPPNTKAEIRLEASEADVREGALALRDSPGLSVLDSPPGARELRMEASSGTFHFSVTSTKR